MRKKKKAWILTFSTTTQAMQMEKFALSHGISGRMIPVPREISAGCGLAWKAEPEQQDEILEALKSAGLEWMGAYIAEI